MKEQWKQITEHVEYLLATTNLPFPQKPWRDSFDQVEILSGEYFDQATAYALRSHGFADHRWIEDYAAINCTVKDGQQEQRFSIDEQFQGRHRCLYNVEQIQGPNLLELPYIPPANLDEPIEAAEAIIRKFGGYQRRSGPSRMTCNSTEASIYLPYPEQFLSRRLFYQVLFHEFGNWGLLPDSASAQYGMQTDAKSVREIIAELTSLYVCSEIGIEHVERSAAYIAFYLKRWYEPQPNVIGILSQYAVRAAIRVFEARRHGA
jgi:antirestriction protein ArdC